MEPRHFHVMGGSSGCYLPDTNELYDSFEDAFESASELADTFYGDATSWWLEEGGDDGYAVFKVMRRGAEFPTATIEVAGCLDPTCEEVE